MINSGIVGRVAGRERSVAPNVLSLNRGDASAYTPPPSRGSVAAFAMLLLFCLAPVAEAQRLPNDRLKSSAAVRRAFRQVVAEPRRATVRVRDGKKDVALGVVVDSAGFVLTKASQLGEAVICRFQDGRELPAHVVGIHRDYDLAMLKVEADNLPVIKWTTEKKLAVGSLLATAGLGKDPLAVGVLSVAVRPIPRERAVLGIAIAEGEDGPKIIQIFPGSGAERAGLKVDDVITHVAGRAVKTRVALIEALQKFRAGDSLKLLILRGNDEKELNATLSNPVSTFPGRSNVQNRLGGTLSRRRTGFEAAFQHDTVLKPEDCGGVIVDLSGRAVGLNIARAGRIETYAIPAAVVVDLLDDLKSGKLAPPKKPAESGEPAPPALPEGPQK